MQIRPFRLILSHGIWVILTILLFRLISLAFIPLTEPSEARYAALATHMAFSGDYTVPYIWVEGCLIPFLGKPPLFFWTEALCIHYLGVNELAARLPCLLYAGLTLCGLLFLLKKSLASSKTELAAVITLSCGFFLVMAGSVTVDMALTFGVATAYFAYFAWLKSQTRKEEYVYSLIVFIGLAIAVLSKGLTGVILFGMPVFVWHLLFGGWKRVLTRHAWCSGLIIFCLLVLPWFFAIHHALQKMDPSFNFFHYFFIEEHLNRFISKNYVDLYGAGRVQPRGISFLFLFLAVLPWGLIPIYWIWKYVRFGEQRIARIKHLFRDNRDELFFALVVLVPVCFLGFARQILITYLLPLIPAFGVWFAMAWVRRYGTKYHVVLYKIGLSVVVIFCAGMACLIPFQSIVLKNMGTEELIAEIVRDTPDARIAVETRDRFYSPYFYGYPYLYGEERADSCPVRTNQKTIVQMPCLRRMPTRLSFNSLRDLKAFASSGAADSQLRIIVLHSNWKKSLPDSPFFSEIRYFRIEPVLPPKKPDRIIYCEKEDAEYERILSKGNISVIRPIVRTVLSQKERP